MRRIATLLLLAVGCDLLLGCGSGSGVHDTWTQKGSHVHASWTVPSASSIDLQLTGATSAASCVTTAKPGSEPGTILVIQGDPAAFFSIGRTLRPGSQVHTSCQVSGTVTGISFGAQVFEHVKSP